MFRWIAWQSKASWFLTCMRPLGLAVSSLWYNNKPKQYHIPCTLPWTLNAICISKSLLSLASESLTWVQRKGEKCAVSEMDTYSLNHCAQNYLQNTVLYFVLVRINGLRGLDSHMWWSTKMIEVGIMTVTRFRQRGGRISWCGRGGERWGGTFTGK